MINALNNAPGLGPKGSPIIGSRNGEILVVHYPLDLEEMLIEAAWQVHVSKRRIKARPNQ
ncbi:MAG: hypothetical protein AAFY56_14760 [Pseudomonadota bacterium]